MSNDMLARYQTAQTLLQGTYSNRLVCNDLVFAHWIGEQEVFWYQRTTRQGREFRLVDARAATNVPAFDHRALASALGQAVGKTLDAADLPLQEVAITTQPPAVNFLYGEKRWRYDPAADRLEEAAGGVTPLAEDAGRVSDCFHQVDIAQDARVSPDGRSAVYIQDHNLWLRDLESGAERALTTNGSPEESYGASLLNMDPSVQAAWSPDSRRLFTLVLDIREVARRDYICYVPDDGKLHPQLSSTKMAYPGDPHIEVQRLVVIDVASGQVRDVDHPPIPITSIISGYFSGQPRGWWAPDSRRAFFIDNDRGLKAVRVLELDTDTGATRLLFEERSDTFVRMHHWLMETHQFLPLPDTDELIWFSERSGWAHLYLYDLLTGDLKHAITQGEWVMRGLLGFDAPRRELLIQATGRDPSINPYYRDICRVNIDSGDLSTLIDGDFDYRVYQPWTHTVLEFVTQGKDYKGINGLSPSRNYVLVTRTRVDGPPVSLLLDRDGNEILTVETADVSGLPRDWVWPEPVEAVGADGTTRICGVVFRPPGASNGARYPVIDYSCSMRSISTLPLGAFSNSVFYGFDYLYAAALAALGFVVVVLEGRGTPLRDKTFSDYRFGDLAYTNDFEDRIAVLQQLSKRYPEMDIERLGLTGHENQTNNVYSVLRHPDVYKVAVVHCLFDSRFTIAASDEAYYGATAGVAPILTPPEDFAANLQGKLFLVQGMMSHLASAGTFRLVEALQKANKDFEMLCMPNMNNFVNNYTARREWDYFVRHLQGVEPPREFPLKTNLPYWD